MLIQLLDVIKQYTTPVITVVLCLTLSGCAQPPPSMERSQYERNPDWSPDEERIAYECIVEPIPLPEDATFDICTVRPDGTSWQRLTTEKSDDREPTWSPDGNRIAFISNRLGWSSDVYLMRPDGSDQHRLTFHGGVRDNLIWSPDGEFIAYSAEQGTSQIYRVNIHSLQVTQLTDASQGERNFDPQWSPNGQRIAFVSDHDGNFEIYLMRADGTEHMNVTNHPASDNNPAWSPDGTRLAFDSNRSGNWDWGIYTISADAPETQISITENTEDGREPAWSPDGIRLAFVSDGIFLVPATGDGTHRTLVADKHSLFRLAWSPDGSKIAFTSSEHIEPIWVDQLWVVNANGSDLKRLTPTHSSP